MEYYHFTAVRSLPKMGTESSGLVTTNQCQQCYKNGHFNDVRIGNLETSEKTTIEPLNFVYSREDLGKDLILSTWECAGVSNKEKRGNRKIRYARPWIIVSENLKLSLEEAKLKSIAFIPIVIK